MSSPTGLEILFAIGALETPSAISSHLSKLDDEDLKSVKEYVDGVQYPQFDKSWANIVNEEYARRIKENRIDKLNDLGI